MVRAALPSHAEALLVESLRANGKAVLSLVAERAESGAVVGHVLFSPGRRWCVPDLVAPDGDVDDG